MMMVHLELQDQHPLGPAEMVEHLKKGLGKEGQVSTLFDFRKVTIRKKT
jgi:hypothetical protein